MSKESKKSKDTKKGKKENLIYEFKYDIGQIHIGEQILYRRDNRAYRPNEPLTLSSLPPKKGPGKPSIKPPKEKG